MTKIEGRKSAAVPDVRGTRRCSKAPAAAPSHDKLQPQETRPEKLQLARWIQKVRQMPAVREDLVERVRLEIAAGIYETPHKLETAVERLLDDLAAS